MGYDSYDPSAVAILTTTFYRSMDELRFRLACKTTCAAREAGHPVLLVDGSPDRSIRDAFTDLGAVVLAETDHGIGPSRRQLFTVACQTSHPFFQWMEIEKTDYIRSIPLVAEPVALGLANVATPRRKDLASYPQFQALTETTADLVYESYMGKGLRPMFGPVLFDREALPYFEECNPALKYGGHDTYIQHIAPMECRANGRRVMSVEVDFTYPPDQRAEEEGALNAEMIEKRLRQQLECVQNYILAGEALGLRSPRL